jgi:hypothetical protein
MARGGAREGAGRPPGINTSWSKDSQDRLRSKIQTEKIIQMLNLIATGEVIVVNSAQVTAALGLLRKIIPDVSAVEHSGEITTSKVIRAPAITSTVPEWSERHIPKQFTEH